MTNKQHQLALPDGSLIQEYEIQGVLGYGSFGIVYKAKHIFFDEIVAIKEFLPCELACRFEQGVVVPISPECEETYNWALDKFVGEAKLIWDLGFPEPHPNIIQVKGFHKTKGTAYMIMKLENGEPLSDLLEQQAPLPQNQIKSFIIPLMDGLEQVHAASVWHRDIKPSNILIRPDGTPVLIDFGAAKQEIGGLANSKILVYTENFAPPEQRIPGSKQGPWTDVYSLGATMYQAVFKKAPGFRFDCTSDLSHIPAIQAVDQGYDLQFLKAIDAAIELEPSDRPQTMRKFRELLGASETRINPQPPGTKIYPSTQPPQSSLSTSNRKKKPPPDVSIFRWISENSITVKLVTTMGVVLSILIVTLVVLRPSDNLTDKNLEREKLLSVINSMTDSIECSDLDLQLSDDFQLVVSGKVSSKTDLQQLKNRLEAVKRLNQIIYQVEIHEQPFCDIVSILEDHKRQQLLHTEEVFRYFNQPPQFYKVSDCLEIKFVGSSAYDGFIYVDFYDGTDDIVVHLRPTPSKFTDALAAGEKRAFGDSGGCEDEGKYKFVSPGKHLISTIYSENPLFDRWSWLYEEEETKKAYLNRLKTAIEAIPPAEKPIIQFDFITVTD